MLLPPLVFPVKTNEIWNSFNECEIVCNRKVKLKIIRENVATKKYTILQDILHLATLLSLAMLQRLRAQTLAPPTPFPL